MKIIFCIYDTFDDNCRIQHSLGKNLKEICRCSSKEQFSFNYYPKVSSRPFMSALAINGLTSSYLELTIKVAQGKKIDLKNG